MNRLLLDHFADTLDTEPFQPTVTAWAREYRHISEGATPGPFDPDETPYTKEIADTCGSSHPARKVVILGPNQGGKTVTLQNVVGECIHQSPGPMLWVVPKADDLAGFVATRIEPLRSHTPVLRTRLGYTATGRKTTKRTEIVKFPGGFLKFAGSKPAETFQEAAIRVVLLDDYDRADDNAEGDCVELAMKRTNTFSRTGAKVIIASTPATAPSKTHKEFLESSQRYYYVPCPHCGAFQRLVWHRLRWESGRPSTAHFVCEHCSKAIHEASKREMLIDGEWRPHRPEFVGIYEGFHFWAAYVRSTSRTWADIAQSWETATKKLQEDNDTTSMQVALNLDRAEVYYPPELVRLNAAEKSVYERVEPVGSLLNEASSRGLITTLGTDVQHNRLESAVYTWGTGAEGWMVEYRVHKGDTSKVDVWNEWAQWVISSGALGVCVDASDNTTVVCTEITRLLPMLAAQGVATWAIKGQEGNGRIWPGQVAPGNLDPHTNRVRVVTIKVDELKAWILGSLLRLYTPGPKFLHFPDTCGQRWFRQLFAYRPRGSTDRKGRSKHVLVHGRRRAEVIDSTNYALAALHARASAGCERSMHVLGIAPTPADTPVVEKPKTGPPRSPDNWVTESIL